MGLLDYLTTHAMDEDYAFVSERVSASRRRSRPGRRIGLVGAVVMAVFAVLVVTAAVQTSRNSANDERDAASSSPRSPGAEPGSTCDRTRLGLLQREVRRLQARQLSSDTSAQGILDTINLLGMRAGTDRRCGVPACAWSPTTPPAPTAPATRCSTPTCSSS